MSAISKMQTAQQITGRMVRDAMQEVQQDGSKMQALQEVVDSRPDAFQDVRAFDEVCVFIQQYYQDQFELRPVTDNPTALPARVDEARITKVTEQDITIDRTPPPPPPPRNYRDPLNITGHAEAGAKVEFYNASQPGRPVIGDVTAGPSGKFRFELTDETKFEFGDQIGIRVIDNSGKPSKPIVVPTDAYQMDVRHITYTRHGRVEGTEDLSSTRFMGEHHDVRNPFYQEDKVQPRFTPPAKPGDPYLLELTGGDDAVEPNSTLTVKVGNQEYVTKADSLGKFGLKVFGFQPGQLLKVEVKDINGKGVDVDYRAPEVQCDVQALTRGVSRPASQTKPRGVDETVGDGPPWIKVKAAHVTVPNGAVIMRNTQTGDLFELNADKEGNINAAVGGIHDFDVLEIAARDANGSMSDQAELAALLPEKIMRGTGYLMPADKLDRAQPDVTSVIESIEGPPKDLFINGQRDARGPYLKLPDIDGMPPFGQLAVVRQGKVIQFLRADHTGKLGGMLRGVNVGDQLNFQVLDACGRKYPMELHGWRVPGLGETHEVPKRHVYTEDRTIEGCVGKIGKGELDVPQKWLEPFTINSGASANPQTNVPLHFPRQFFGAKGDQKTEANVDFFPPAIQTKLGLPYFNSAKLGLTENNGTKRLEFTTTGHNNSVRTASLGVDYTMGTINMGHPDQPIRVPDSLATMTEVLRGALAFTALAYSNGHEPGDMEYDRAMGAVKTTLYVFDRLATLMPDHKDAIEAAARAAFPDDGFNFEVIDRFKVPPPGVEEPSAHAGQPRSGAMSLLDARTALLGKVSGVGEVGEADHGGHPAPRIESASVLVQRYRQSNRSQYTFRYPSNPLRVKGSAKPGDIVQVYNVSTGQKVLLSETTVGPDGRFSLMTGARDIKQGDQLGVMSVTPDGKKSALSVVPTDSYVYDGSSDSALANARPIARDDRPPFFRPGGARVHNSSFDDAGAVRPGGPFWTLSGEELSAEPFSTIKVYSETPDGQRHEIETKVDGEGRFDLEFPARARRQFTVQITDRNGNKSSVKMSTPLLASSVNGGDDSVDTASGVVKFNLATGERIRGVVVANSLGSSDNAKDLVRISAADRHDDYVDVFLNQRYSWSDPDGRERENNYLFKVKIAKEDADKFTAQINDKVSVDWMGFDSIPNGSNTEMQPKGDASLVDRDYLLSNLDDAGDQ